MNVTAVQMFPAETSGVRPLTDVPERTTPSPVIVVWIHREINTWMKVIAQVTIRRHPGGLWKLPELKNLQRLRIHFQQDLCSSPAEKVQLAG